MRFIKIKFKKSRTFLIKYFAKIISNIDIEEQKNTMDDASDKERYENIDNKNNEKNEGKKQIKI